MLVTGVLSPSSCIECVAVTNPCRPQPNLLIYLSPATHHEHNVGDGCAVALLLPLGTLLSTTPSCPCP